MNPTRGTGTSLLPQERQHKPLLLPAGVWLAPSDEFETLGQGLTHCPPTGARAQPHAGTPSGGPACFPVLTDYLLPPTQPLPSAT